MRETIKIAKMLSKFKRMNDMNSDTKDNIIAFRKQLDESTNSGEMQIADKRIVLKLLGLNATSHFKDSYDNHRLYNILNIVELCATVDMTDNEIYSYILGEYNLHRINKSDRELLIEMFNVGYKNDEVRSRDIRYCTLQDIKDMGWTVNIYQDNKLKSYYSRDLGFDFMMQNRKVLNSIKAGNYYISGYEVKKGDGNGYSPLKEATMVKILDVYIHPLEIAQAERVLKYVEKYDSLLCLTKEIDKR